LAAFTPDNQQNVTGATVVIQFLNQQGYRLLTKSHMAELQLFNLMREQLFNLQPSTITPHQQVMIP